MVCRLPYVMFFPLHRSESQCPSAHTGGRKLPGSSQEHCFHMACSLCHKHEHERGMFSLPLAAPSPLRIQEMQNATDAGGVPPRIQSLGPSTAGHRYTRLQTEQELVVYIHTASYDSPALVIYTLVLCFLFILVTGASIQKLT